MRLSELFREVEFDGSIKNDADINFVTDDSRLVRPGSLFVCIRHRSFDGHTAALDALASGAAAVVTQDRLGLENELHVADSRGAYARLCAALCGHPERRSRMIGVTGTNGKTTVTTLIRNILSDSGAKTLLTGTVCNRLGDENLPSGLTTPKPPELYSLLSRAVSQGCKACVMEASSQALAQGRLEGIDFDAAVFTNITRDHLDYHGTFENYLSAKKKLFEHSTLSIVNLDDPRAGEIIAAAKAASAHDFIMKLPDAYETRVGAGGHDLSGGERQRISIARTIIQNPRILILDEATAAMDTETERNIQYSLTKLMQGRTTVAIAHRLSTLRDADMLAVINEGEVVEYGSYAELLKKRGEFYKLYKIQAEALKAVGIID